MYESRNSRFEENDEQLASQVATEYFGSTASARVNILGSGDCNVNYLAVTPEKTVVVKLSKPDREEKALEGYTKERWCIAKAREMGILTPEVIQIGQKNGRTYMIQSFVEGVSGADAKGLSSLSEEEKRGVWRMLGEYAHSIHSIPVIGYGDTMAEDGVFAGSWIAHLQYNIDSLNDDDELLKRNVLTKTLSGRVRSAFESLRTRDFRFALSHSDLALRNTIVSSDGKVYLLDWDTAKAEIVPHYDFNEILRDSQPSQEAFNAFLEGYGMSEEEFKAIEQDLLVLNLLRSIDTLRWAIDRAPEVIPQHVETVQQSLNRLGWE